MLDWLHGCSETRVYRLGEGWTFRLHRGARGHVSVTCPTNRGDELIHPAQGAWADKEFAGLEGVRRVHEGYFEIETQALEQFERQAFGDAQLAYRGFMAHDHERLAPILAQRRQDAIREAYSLSRTPHDLSFALSLSRSDDSWVVYGVWAVNREPKNYKPVRADFFEAYPELADIEAVAKAVGPQRQIPLAPRDVERVLAAFSRTPRHDFSYVTASWTLGS